MPVGERDRTGGDLGRGGQNGEPGPAGQERVRPLSLSRLTARPKKDKPARIRRTLFPGAWRKKKMPDVPTVENVSGNKKHRIGPVNFSLHPLQKKCPVAGFPFRDSGRHPHGPGKISSGPFSGRKNGIEFASVTIVTVKAIHWINGHSEIGRSVSGDRRRPHDRAKN